MPRVGSYFAEFLRFLHFFNNDDFTKPSRISVSKDYLREVHEQKNFKASPFYTAHSYPTKVPVQLISRFLLKHTEQGQIVLDPFCGSGMTGLACKLTGRNGIISDLGTLATHIAFNHSAECDSAQLREAAERIKNSLREKDPYQLTLRGKPCSLRWVIHSAQYRCTGCKHVQAFWDVAVDPKSKNVIENPKCKKCRRLMDLSATERTAFAPAYLSFVSEQSKGEEVKVDKSDLRKLEFELPSNFKLPVENLSITADREMYIRSALHLHSVNNLSDFYTPRNLYALSSLFIEIQKERDNRVRAALMFAFTNTCWHSSKLRRFNNAGGHRPLTGTLYIPQLISEGNVYEIFFRKISGLQRYYSLLRNLGSNSTVKTSQVDATNLKSISADSVDYVFTDPPFGSNIFYADCNFLAEAWLGKATDRGSEAVVNKSLKPENGGKTLKNYGELLERAFSEMARVLKRGKRADIVFNNTDGETWSVVQAALNRAGFAVADTSSLNKVQMSVKGYKGAGTGENVATTDIVLGVINKRAKYTAVPNMTKQDHHTLVPKIFKLYMGSNDVTTDRRFLIPDFFSFYVRYCHEKRVSIAGLTLSLFREILQAQDLLSFIPPKATNSRSKEIA